MAETRSKLSIIKSGDTITIAWISGVPPFQLQRTQDLKSWESAWNPTMARSRSFPIDGDMAFFRLQEAVPLLDIDLEYELATRLIWGVPDLE